MHPSQHIGNVERDWKSIIALGQMPERGPLARAWPTTQVTIGENSYRG